MLGFTFFYHKYSIIGLFPPPLLFFFFSTANRSPWDLYPSHFSAFVLTLPLKSWLRRVKTEQMMARTRLSAWVASTPLPCGSPQPWFKEVNRIIIIPEPTIPLHAIINNYMSVKIWLKRKKNEFACLDLWDYVDFQINHWVISHNFCVYRRIPAVLLLTDKPISTFKNPILTTSLLTKKFKQSIHMSANSLPRVEI